MHIPIRHARISLHTDISEVHKDFALADGYTTPETNIAKLEHIVREPTRTVNMVPAWANQSLLNGGKSTEAEYVSVCDGDKVSIYDWWSAKITVSDDAVLKGWRCLRTKL